MAPHSELATLTTGTQLREASAVHMAIHGEPETVWDDFLHRHPRWAAPGAHRAVIEDGRIVALATAAMYCLRFGDTTLPAGEIGLVGTLPDYRQRGHSRRLMESWLGTMREQSVPLSYLVGIPGFYERWDYHYACPDQVNHFLAISHDPLTHCARSAGTVRDADLDRDIPAICELLATEAGAIPCSPVIDVPLLRHFLDQAETHGVAWRVIEIDGEVEGVVRHKRWGEGIGPQAPGAVTMVAARDDEARGAVAAMLLDHLLGGNQAELPLAIAPHGPFGRWLVQRGATRKSDRSIFPGGYAAMVRINDLVAVLEALRGDWETHRLADRHAGTSITLRTGREAAQVATIKVSGGDTAIVRGDGGIEVGAPPAVTVPWLTGWRSAADWLDGTPFPPLPGPSVDAGDPATLSYEIRALLRDLFPVRHPYIGDMTQGA